MEIIISKDKAVSVSNRVGSNLFLFYTQTVVFIKKIYLGACNQPL